MSPTAAAAPGSSPPAVGPVTFVGGPLAGQTLRGAIEEIQAASLGRKFSKKDRRPIDPPPIALGRVYCVIQSKDGEIEREAEDYDVSEYNFGFVCHVDLFRLPEGEPDGSIAGEEQDVKCTDKLAGTTFTHSVVIPMDGKQRLLFPFTDVSVRQEGLFRFRYTLFNIASHVLGTTTHPALAQCYGATFRVYSTTTCPALPPSTSLSKHLSLMGVRINVRENARRPRRGQGRSAVARKQPAVKRGADEREEVDHEQDSSSSPDGG